MTEKEKVVLIDTILSFMEDMHKNGKSSPGPYAIAHRLRVYTERYEQILAQQQNS